MTKSLVSLLASNTISEGPKFSTLNDNSDGPLAFADRESLAAYAATEWLFDYAQDAVDSRNCTWRDFGDANGILETYPILFETPARERYEREISRDQITPRGIEILDAACRGEDVSGLFEMWQDDLFWSQYAD